MQRRLFWLRVFWTLTVLDLLAVTWWLLQCLDDERSGRWHNRNGSLTILDAQANGDFQALPVSGGLCDVITNFLWRLFREGIKQR